MLELHVILWRRWSLAHLLELIFQRLSVSPRMNREDSSGGHKRLLLRFYYRGLRRLVVGRWKQGQRIHISELVGTENCCIV